MERVIHCLRCGEAMALDPVTRTGGPIVRLGMEIEFTPCAGVARRVCGAHLYICGEMMGKTKVAPDIGAKRTASPLSPTLLLSLDGRFYWHPTNTNVGTPCSGMSPSAGAGTSENEGEKPDGDLAEPGADGDAVQPAQQLTSHCCQRTVRDCPACGGGLCSQCLNGCFDWHPVIPNWGTPCGCVSPSAGVHVGTGGQFGRRSSGDLRDLESLHAPGTDESGLGKKRRDRVEGDGASSRSLLEAALEALAAPNISDQDLQSHFRPLARILGVPNCKTPSKLAMKAVLAQLASPSRYTRDKEAWVDWGAKESNFRWWKRNILALHKGHHPRAGATLVIPGHQPAEPATQAQAVSLAGSARHQLAPLTDPAPRLALGYHGFATHPWETPLVASPPQLARLATRQPQPAQPDTLANGPPSARPQLRHSTTEVARCPICSVPFKAHVLAGHADLCASRAEPPPRRRETWKARRHGATYGVDSETIDGFEFRSQSIDMHGSRSRGPRSGAGASPSRSYARRQAHSGEKPAGIASFPRAPGGVDHERSGHGGGRSTRGRPSKQARYSRVPKGRHGMSLHEQGLGGEFSHCVEKDGAMNPSANYSSPPPSDDEERVDKRIRREAMAGGGIKYTPVVDLCSSESDEDSRGAGEGSERAEGAGASSNNDEGVGTSAAHAGAQRPTVRRRATGAEMLLGLQIRLYTSYTPTGENRGLRGRTADITERARDGQIDSFRLRFGGASTDVTAILRRDLRLHTSAELTRVGQWQTVYNVGPEMSLEEGEKPCQTCFFPNTGTCSICTGNDGQGTRSGKRREH
jgi:hypothetical protein